MEYLEKFEFSENYNQNVILRGLRIKLVMGKQYQLISNKKPVYKSKRVNIIKL